MKNKEKKKGKKKGKKPTKDEQKEYGVVLTKDDKFKHRIYPQKGKVPDEKEDDSYKIV